MNQEKITPSAEENGVRPYQRARREAEKAERVEAILRAAARRFDTAPYEQCNLAQIAADVGLSKPALYRYFRVKELIFLELYKRELAALAPTLEQALHQPEAEELATLLLARPRFCKLSAMLTAVLEKPLTVAEARAFKHYVLAVLQPVIGRLCQQFHLTAEQGVRWLMHILAALVGCWHVSHTSPLMEQALSSPELTPFKQEFSPLLHDHLLRLLTPQVQQLADRD